MIRIPFVERRGIVDHDNIGFQQAEKEREPRPHLDDWPGIHAVVRVFQEERVFAAQTFGYFDGVAFILLHDLPIRRAGTRHGVVRHGDQITRTAFVDQLQYGPGGEDRDIITMRLNRTDNLSLSGLTGAAPLNNGLHLVRNVACTARFVFSRDGQVLAGCDLRRAAQERSLQKAPPSQVVFVAHADHLAWSVTQTSWPATSPCRTPPSRHRPTWRRVKLSP